MAKRKITHRIVLGDSLSDRGTLDKRKILGIIPMNYLSGLSSKSPRGRFTNGFLWGDFIATTAIQQLQIERLRRGMKLKKTARDNADIADAIISNAYDLHNRNEDAFTLDNDGQVLYEGHRFARFYCEGGLTAHDFSGELTFNPGEEGARLTVAILEDKRKQLLNDDARLQVSSKEKKATLITEWSGANDLITVNNKPSRESANKAIAARMLNLEKLILSGYQNFSMMNMPDLSLAPRYQRKNTLEQTNAKQCSDYFNAQLLEKCEQLKQKYPDVYIDVFDVCDLLRQVHDTPELYGFDKDKLTTPFVETDEFRKNQTNPDNKVKQTSPSEGYMFWDDVHPTADMHAWLAVKFEEKYNPVFKYESPAAKVCRHDAKVRDVKDRYGLITHRKEQILLPADVLEIMASILENARKMMTSLSSIRKEKGQLLLELLEDIHYAHGNLEKVRRIITRFQDVPEKAAIIAIHQNPVFDMLFFKHTTRSQDTIQALLDAVILNIQKNDPGCKDELRAKYCPH